MESLKIKFNEFDPERMVKTSVDSKQSKPKIDPSNPNKAPESVQYQSMQLMYRYPVKRPNGEEFSIVAPLCIEAPVLSTPNGISRKIQPSGQESASIFTVFDLSKPEVREFVADGSEGQENGCIEKIYRWCLNRLFEVKPQVPSFTKFSKIEHFESIFPYPIFWPRDQQTGQIMRGKNPTKYFNLMSYGKVGSPGRKETLFSVPIRDETNPVLKQYKTIPWSALENVEMAFQPLINFRQIYIGGGKASLQFEISSSVIYSVVRANTESAQRSTLDTLAAKSEVTATIQAQIAALMGTPIPKPVLQEPEHKEEKQTPVEEHKEEKQETPSPALPASKPRLVLRTPLTAIMSSQSKIPSPSNA